MRSRPLPVQKWRTLGKTGGKVLTQLVFWRDILSRDFNYLEFTVPQAKLGKVGFAKATGFCAILPRSRGRGWQPRIIELSSPIDVNCGGSKAFANVANK